ncbi:MAG: GNAT family N-acetyltransferase [Pseudomonadota bacterium]
MTPPTLHTERLTLTAPSARHFAPLAEFYASERSSFVGGPLTADKAWRALAMEAGHWSLRGYGRFAVELTETGELVGIVGPWFPEGNPEPEIGWDLMNGYEGKGYAAEAAIEARRWVYEDLGWQTAMSLVDPDNIASAKLSERMGCKKDGQFHSPSFGALDIWRHPGPEAL